MVSTAFFELDRTTVLTLTTGMTYGAFATAVLVGAMLLAATPELPTQGQPQRGGQGRAEQAPANAPVLARVRVPTSHANVHTGPSTTNELLVVAAQGTTMDMVGQRGEWLQVRLTPEMRKTGILMRWYRNETSGWMHDSTVEFLTPRPSGDGR